MKRILLNWYYHRPDLTEYLLKLSDEFELVFIFKHERPCEREWKQWSGKNISVVYWGDYKTPYQLLKKVKPDIVVFYDIEAFNQVALNVAARNKKIPTYVLQHGVRGDYEVAEALTYSEKESINFSDTSTWSIKFFLAAFRFKNILDILSIGKFIINRKRFELTVALAKSKAEWRNADYYIELSKANTGYHKMRDGIPDDRFIIIGNPQFDIYFEQLNAPSKQETEPYALLIDAPFCEAVFLRKERMAIAEKNDYLKNINLWCIAKKLRLFIKLHPLTYNVDYLLKDNNITYYKGAELGTLIKGSTVVFFVHFSSLTPLIILYKPFIYLASSYLPPVNFIKEKSIPVINITDFSANINREPSPPLPIKDLEDQLYKAGGNALERLRNILRGNKAFTTANEVS